MAQSAPENVDLSRVEQARATRDRILVELRKVIVGQEDLIDEVLLAMFAGGHVLLVGVPGLAKTLLVSTLAKALSMNFKRIQFTPDMMPSDITGTEVLEEDHATGHKQFVFVQGPVFTNLLLADEINRTPPKTQAALLEAMQEKNVTVGKKTYALQEPFMVMATQNPIEQEGTYPLPEAQLDRFMFMVWVDYPSDADLKTIIKRTTAGALEQPKPVLDGPGVLELRKTVRMIPISDHVVDYIVRLVTATHPNDTRAPEKAKKYLSWGAGPRAGQYLALGAKSRALLRGSLQATIEDVKAVALPVLRHRIVTNFAAQADGVNSDGVIKELLRIVPES
ncbi:ATPase AAA [Verrucomicrobiota bacterium]|nr:ATPase AAA [Verrucomicrobiota bacterium]